MVVGKVDGRVCRIALSETDTFYLFFIFSSRSEERDAAAACSSVRRMRDVTAESGVISKEIEDFPESVTSFMYIRDRMGPRTPP